MIDLVIEDLDRIVAESKSDASPVGYFAALYRDVTISVRDSIEAGAFDDGPRMEAFDVRFAQRYLDALSDYRSGRPVRKAWQLAFDTTREWWPTVLQHLLLGMNAHINLDLGIAAARVAPGSSLPSLRADFERINTLLANLVDQAQARLAEVWPALHLLDHTAGRTDEAVVNFAISRARDHAWAVAERLAPIPPEEQEPLIRTFDAETADVGGRVRHPGFWVSTVLRVVRLGEIGTVSRKIARVEGVG